MAMTEEQLKELGFVQCASMVFPIPGKGQIWTTQEDGFDGACYWKFDYLYLEEDGKAETFANGLAPDYKQALKSLMGFVDVWIATEELPRVSGQEISGISPDFDFLAARRS